MYKIPHKNLRLLIAVIFAGVLFSLPLQAVEQPTVIALFGDSITIGRNAAHPNPTPPKVGNGTTENGLPTTLLQGLMDSTPKRTAVVANWGLGGSTSVSGVNRISDDLASNTSQHNNGKDYYVLIMYGTNDFNNGGISSNATAANIGIMIDKADQAGYKPVIGTITPRSDQYSEVVARNGKIKTEVTSKSAQVACDIVDHHQLFLDAGWESLINIEFSSFTGTSFRLHPNDQGYAVLAQNWFDECLMDSIAQDFNPAIVVPAISLLLED